MARMIPVQSSLADWSPEYAAFLDKFKPKKTTDDCYTPPNVYEAVAGWVAERYGIDRARFVRPFWPGGDYEAFRYGDDAVVVDNPPFSIVGKIVDFYNRHGVGFFLFAPYLSNIGIGRGVGCCHVIAPWTVLYENGAGVPTSFVTNLDRDLVAEACPELRARVRKADEENRAKTKAELPVYSYPDELVTSASLGYLASRGTALKIRRGDCVFVRALDAQRATGKSIFGGGLLLSERAAAERAAAERAAAERAAAERAAAERAAAERAAAHVWKLSEREREIVAGLGVFQ